MSVTNISVRRLQALNFFIKKKFIVFLICASFSINGFATSAAEVSKYSFVMVMAAATQNIAAQIFFRCNDSLANISNKIYVQFKHFLFDDDAHSAAASEQSGKKRPNNTADGQTILVKRVTSSGKNSGFAADLQDGDNSGFFRIAALYRLYENSKLPPAALTGIILLFLVFLAAIIRRKEFPYSNFITGCAYGKTRISA